MRADEKCQWWNEEEGDRPLADYEKGIDLLKAS